MWENILKTVIVVVAEEVIREIFGDDNKAKQTNR